MPAIDPISEILSDTLNRFIRPRRRVQATAITTLIKHIIEGSERRYQRLGAEAYREEYNQVRLAIVHPNVAKHIYDLTHEDDSIGGYTGENSPDKYQRGGIVHPASIIVPGTDMYIPYDDGSDHPGGQNLPSLQAAKAMSARLEQTFRQNREGTA